MLKVKRILLTSLAVVLCASAALAVPRGNESELQLSADFFTQQGSDTGSATLDMEWGQYSDDASLEYGIRQSGTYNFADGGPDSWLAVTSPFIHINFLNGTDVVPYVGGFVGAVWNEDDITGTVGPEAGFRAFVSEDAFLNVGYRYEWFFEEFNAADDNASDGNHIGTVGIGFIY